MIVNLLNIHSIHPNAYNYYYYTYNRLVTYDSYALDNYLDTLFSTNYSEVIDLLCADDINMFLDKLICHKVDIPALAGIYKFVSTIIDTIRYYNFCSK